MTNSNSLHRAASGSLLADLDARHATMIAGLLQVAINAVEERRLIQELRRELQERNPATAAAMPR